MADQIPDLMEALDKLRVTIDQRMAEIAEKDRRIARLTKVALAAKRLADHEGFGVVKYAPGDAEGDLYHALQAAGFVAPIEQMAGKLPLILYFETDQDREEFKAVMKAAMSHPIEIDVP
jgi:hypothetical protein